VNGEKGHFNRSNVVAIVGIWIVLSTFLIDAAFAQIGPSPGNNFSTQTLTKQENNSFLHNTVNDQCCLQRLNGGPVVRGLTPNLFGFRAGFDQDGVDFRGDDPTHRGCVESICFSIPAMHTGADTQFGNRVPVGSTDSVLPFLLPSTTLVQNEQIVATNGSNSSAPFDVDFSITHSQALFSRPEPGGTGNRLNTVFFDFNQSVQSGVPGGDREGPITFLNGDDRDSGEGTGCRFCGDHGAQVTRQQDFGMSFSFVSKTDGNGNRVGSVTGTFQQTLAMSDVLAPNNTVSCGSDSGSACIRQIGPLTIQGTFTYDGNFVNVTTNSIDINGVPQAVGSTDPLGVPTRQTIRVP